MRDLPTPLIALLGIYVRLIDVLLSGYFLLFPVREAQKRRFIVCGVEIATNIISIKKLIPEAMTVNFYSHRFHSFHYDHGPWNKMIFTLIGPWLLVYFSRLADIFIYNWETGFAYDRAVDFAFLKGKGKKIVQIHCGEDIRSHKLMGEYYRKIGWPDHTKHRWKMKALLRDPQGYEAHKKRNARTTDKYADVVFSKEIDNMSYITSRINNFFYLADPQDHPSIPGKFDDLSVPKIVHAPSSPSNKGTPLVREAIEKLRAEGYVFEYTELIGMPHSEVIRHMSESHIVMNQFYSFCHGTFGVEAMLSKNCMFTSADPRYTHELYEDAEKAWVVTHYDKVYEKVKWILDHPEKIKQFAEKGHQYALRNFTIGPVRTYFKEVLTENGLTKGGRELETEKY